MTEEHLNRMEWRHSQGMIVDLDEVGLTPYEVAHGINCDELSDDFYNYLFSKGVVQDIICAEAGFTK